MLNRQRLLQCFAARLVNNRYTRLLVLPGAEPTDVTGACVHGNGATSVSKP